MRITGFSLPQNIQQRNISFTSATIDIPPNGAKDVPPFNKTDDKGFYFYRTGTSEASRRYYAIPLSTPGVKPIILSKDGLSPEDNPINIKRTGQNEELYYARLKGASGTGGFDNSKVRAAAREISDAMDAGVKGEAVLAGHSDRNVTTDWLPTAHVEKELRQAIADSSTQ